MTTQKKEKERLGFKKGFVALVFILELMLVFAFFDYVVHTVNPDYTVPLYFFTTKIIYGTLVGFIAYLFVRKKPLIQKSAILAAVVSVLLQIRYLLAGYPTSFVLIFLIIHFVILFIVTYVGCKIARM